MPMEAMCSLISEIIATGNSAQITVNGDSMYPMLRSQISCVRLKACDEIRIGDLPLYRRENGAYILHRIIGERDGAFVCCGDNQWCPERRVERAQIVALVTHYKRTDKWRSCYTRPYRLYVWFWIRTRPLRRLFIGGGRRVRRLLACIFTKKQ